MPKFITLLALIRALGPVVYLIAQAFQYGCSRFGDGEWKKHDAEYHIDRALYDLLKWRSGRTDKPYLVDAALRSMFATYQAIAFKKIPAEYKK